MYRGGLQEGLHHKLFPQESHARSQAKLEQGAGKAAAKTSSGYVGPS